jgi:hypothetical protein
MFWSGSFSPWGRFFCCFNEVGKNLRHFDLHLTLGVPLLCSVITTIVIKVAGCYWSDDCSLSFIGHHLGLTKCWQIKKIGVNRKVNNLFPQKTEYSGYTKVNPNNWRHIYTSRGYERLF